MGAKFDDEMEMKFDNDMARNSIMIWEQDLIMKWSKI